MAKSKKGGGGVYRIVDVVGVSKTSWEDAGKRAVETAAGSLRDLRVAEVTKMDMTVENGRSGVPHPCRAVVQVRELSARLLFARAVHRHDGDAPTRVLRLRALALAQTLIFSSSSTRRTAAGSSCGP